MTMNCACDPCVCDPCACSAPVVAEAGCTCGPNCECGPDCGCAAASSPTVN